MSDSSSDERTMTSSGKGTVKELVLDLGVKRLGDERVEAIFPLPFVGLLEQLEMSAAEN